MSIFYGRGGVMAERSADGDTMPLAHAHDALSDCVSQFHNHMLSQGTRELSPRQWVEEFRAWLDPYSFEDEYERTKKWLADHPDG